jgi:hypothetical protein
VSRAASIVSREGAALPANLLGPSGSIATAGSGAPSSTGAGVPAGLGLPAMQDTTDIERLRRQAHDLIETLLTSFSPKAPGAEERVPLLSCASPVVPGGEGTVTVRVANEDVTPIDVTLYSSNFISDSGCEIPSMQVTVSPRSVLLAPQAQTTFTVKISVPQQTQSGVYSGLVQATGARYVKAVVCLEVK